ncbi:flagellar basal body P-ring formation chaperone FlgA [Dyella acidiphila]|uniref:Flagella basal body P-ring formation protein FlgA n=1 Tax=Dyella acidiphila TaxID=2775866 RepID=A0ABR9G970_9GAMM|nr:flagellar basal body P-ring formation chaperone FlgA [Dyella acidiphila]MBE1160603.1 flagellar basal body P-ring formation protein FlgA [Dyella acidiphila]
MCSLRLRFGLAMAAGLLAPMHAMAGQVQDVVASAARTWLVDWARQANWPDPEIDVVVLPLRRPEPSCGQSLKVMPADTSQLARLRFSARCPDGASETYTVRAAVHSKALAVISAVPAGKPIDKSDVQQVDVNVALTPDAVRDPAEVAGRASQRPLRAGQVVQARFLKAGASVRRGQLVQIVSRQQHFQVSTQGTAMQRGEGNELVRVRVDASGKSILAWVVGPGVVEPMTGDSKAPGHPED